MLLFVSQGCVECRTLLHKSLRALPLRDQSGSCLAQQYLSSVLLHVTSFADCFGLLAHGQQSLDVYGSTIATPLRVCEFKRTGGCDR